MSILPNRNHILPGLILRATKPGPDREKEVLRILEEYGREVRDKTLEWALENAKHYNSSDEYDPQTYSFIDKDSILNGKTSKDLEI